MSFRGMYGTEYEQRAASAETSEEVVYAIELLADGTIDDEESEAYQLWADGGRDDEVLAALPICDQEEGDELFWGGKWAEYDGEKWQLTRK